MTFANLQALKSFDLDFSAMENQTSITELQNNNIKFNLKTNKKETQTKNNNNNQFQGGGIDQSQTIIDIDVFRRYCLCVYKKLIQQENNNNIKNNNNNNNLLFKINTELESFCNMNDQQLNDYCVQLIKSLTFYSTDDKISMLRFLYSSEFKIFNINSTTSISTNPPLKQLTTGFEKLVNQMVLQTFDIDELGENQTITTVKDYLKNLTDMSFSIPIIIARRGELYEIYYKFDVDTIESCRNSYSFDANVSLSTYFKLFYESAQQLRILHSLEIKLNRIETSTIAASQDEITTTSQRQAKLQLVGLTRKEMRDIPNSRFIQSNCRDHKVNYEEQNGLKQTIINCNQYKLNIRSLGFVFFECLVNLVNVKSQKPYINQLKQSDPQGNFFIGGSSKQFSINTDKNQGAVSARINLIIDELIKDLKFLYGQYQQEISTQIYYVVFAKVLKACLSPEQCCKRVSAQELVDIFKTSPCFSLMKYDNYSDEQMMITM